MLKLKPFIKESWSVDDAGATQVAPSHLTLAEAHVLLSLRVTGFHTQTLAYMLDSLVRVSRRVD